MPALRLELGKVGIEQQLKRAELRDEVQQLVVRIEAIKKQVVAINQVIAIYDPVHTAPLCPGSGHDHSSGEVLFPTHSES
jgi:hypothetical protein